MKRYGLLMRKMLSPPNPLLLILLLVSTVCLAAVFMQGLDQTAFAYVVYVVSAYTMVAAVLRAVALWKKGKALLHQNAFLHQYMTDLDFKAEVSIHLSFGITLFYCVYKVFAGIYYHSVWFGSMALYYLILGVMRFELLHHIRRDQDDRMQDYRKYRFCGCLLLVLTAALGIMSFYTIYGDKATEYPYYMIYAAAGFTFYNLSMAIVNLVRYRKRKNPIYLASKILTLATALVSMFFLQNSMLAAFGDGDVWQKYMSIGTGAVVFLLIAGMALLMIWNGGKALAAHVGQNR